MDDVQPEPIPECFPTLLEILKEWMESGMLVTSGYQTKCPRSGIGANQPFETIVNGHEKAEGELPFLCEDRTAGGVLAAWVKGWRDYRIYHPGKHLLWRVPPEPFWCQTFDGEGYWGIRARLLIAGSAVRVPAAPPMDLTRPKDLYLPEEPRRITVG